MAENEAGEKIILKKRDKTIFYTVKSGDNIWKISHKFGLKVRTLLWANSLTAKESLRPGEKIRVPPVDGVYYTVKKRETLGEITKAHGAEIEKIQLYNGLKNNIIKVDQELFVPGVQKVFIAEKAAIEKTNYSFTYGRPGGEGQALGSIGFNLIRPTRGVLTQGFRRGHYAIDIANKRNTPIYASAGGTVKIARSSGWNYGYGTYLTIDHGNDVETLYAHNNVIKVSEGQTIKPGQLVALMGNSGRVFGATGIHLHFELRIRGRKVNPYNYFQ